ncbi:MAG: hypothetical protein NPIRA05_17350 [Nitrospirales bacterium]|nr:MAG: hypothetical protein NPIRA05_17350 [Nitrospirales bacterium]
MPSNRHDIKAPPRTLAVWILGLPILVALVYLSQLEWHGERAVDALVHSRISTDGVSFPPLTEAPWRVAASVLLFRRSDDFNTMEHHIEKALRLRPLYAPTWLERAELERRRGDLAEAARFAEHARALWSTRPTVLWQLANFEIKLGRNDIALDVLKDYWRSRPYDSLRVLSLARRLQANPEMLYVAISPGPPATIKDTHFYSRQYLDYARRIKNIDMVRAAWNNAPDELKSDTNLALDTIDFMISQQQTEFASQLWQQLTRNNPVGNIFNPGFESEVSGGGFGWRINTVKGAIINTSSTVAHGGSHALQIEFNGTENLNFHHVRQYILVEPNSRYRLTGIWRGEDITTRSGIFVDLRTIDTQKNSYSSTNKKYKTWDWQSFALELETPADTSLLELRIRRNSTDALDARLAGRVWFDDFRLEKIQ